MRRSLLLLLSRVTAVTTALAGPAAAQTIDVPRLSVGVGIAVSCPGTNDGIPTLDLQCHEAREGAPGPYVRPYVSFRPADRLLLTTTLGYLRMPAIETTVFDDGLAPPVTLVVQPRTAWHVQGTAAYVGGRHSHAVRAYVGGGLVYSRDPLRQELRGPLPPYPIRAIDARRWSIDGLFTTGLLFRMPGRFAGRLGYTLAEQLNSTTVSDGGWRHEIALGVDWGLRR